VGDYEVIVNQ